MFSFAKLLLRTPLNRRQYLGSVSVIRNANKGGAIVSAGDYAQRLSYHSTPTRQFPARRRQHPGHRKQTDPEESADADHGNPLQQKPVEDTARFREAADNLLTRLEKGLEPMKEENDPFILERTRGDLGEILTLDLGAKLGNYRIEFSEDEHVFEYSSPISGKLLYVLSAESGEWVGQNDGHNFEGLLVRDLIRYCRGMPDL